MPFTLNTETKLSLHFFSVPSVSLLKTAATANLRMMNSAAALRSLYTSAARRPTPVYDFLAPCLIQGPSRTQCASITSSSAPPSTEPKPEALNSTSSAKRRRPLTPEQKNFLDSAVSSGPVSPATQPPPPSHLTASISTAARQPSRRTRRHTNLHRADAPACKSTPTPASPHATHVRSRSRALLHLQPPPRPPPHPPHSHVSRVEARRHSVRLEHSGDGAGGGDGVHGGRRDGDRGTL